MKVSRRIPKEEKSVVLSVIALAIAPMQQALATEDDAEARAQVMMSELMEDGYTDVLHEASSVLPPDGVTQHQVHLQQGTTYAIYSTGDARTTDIDLYVYGPSGGAPVAKDVELDTNPIVFYSPRESGPHDVHVANAGTTSGWNYTVVAF
ncbi:hypothetical protein [Myxococcus sp. Y35]|uniref:hypothetical protein n=1 Tax=Pseudomyxococcus flavus TaxID=3115648 RepID=UPI003CF4B1F9